MIIYHDRLKSDICDLIINKFEELNERNIFSEKNDDDIRIFGFERVLKKDIAELFFNIDNQSSKRFFKKKPITQTIMVNKTFKPSKKKGLGSGGGWHRDSYVKKQMKTIFYLTSVNIDNGPFTYLHPKIKIINRFYPIKVRLSENIENDLKIFSNKTSITSETPGLGFSIITNYIHRGIPVKKDVRYALTVYSSYDKKDNKIDNLKIKL